MKNIYVVGVLTLLFTAINISAQKSSLESFADSGGDEKAGELNKDHSQSLYGPKSLYLKQAIKDIKDYLPEFDLDEYTLGSISVNYYPAEMPFHPRFVVVDFTKNGTGKRTKKGDIVEIKQDRIRVSYDSGVIGNRVNFSITEKGKHTEITKEIDLKHLYTPKEVFVNQATKDLKKHMPDIDLSDYTLDLVSAFYWLPEVSSCTKSVSVGFNKNGTKKETKTGNSTSVSHDGIHIWYDSGPSYRRTKITISEDGSSTPITIYHEKF